MHALKRCEGDITACRISFVLMENFYLGGKLKQQVYNEISTTIE